MVGSYRDALKKQKEPESTPAEINAAPRMTKKEQRYEKLPDNRTYC